MRLLLFSGGVDSTCLARMYRPNILLTIDYGQKSAAGELRASSYIAKNLQLRHEIIRSDIGSLGAGDLAGSPPTSSSGVVETWPFRNQFFVTIAAMRYAREGVNEIMIGTLATDHVHPDGSSQFVDKISDLVQHQEPSLRVVAPAITRTAYELIKDADIGSDLLGWTFSCHVAAVACGRCRGCTKSVELFEKLTLT